MTTGTLADIVLTERLWAALSTLLPKPPRKNVRGLLCPMLFRPQLSRMTTGHVVIVWLIPDPGFDCSSPLNLLSDRPRSDLSHC